MGLTIGEGSTRLDAGHDVVRALGEDPCALFFLCHFSVAWALDAACMHRPGLSYQRVRFAFKAGFEPRATLLACETVRMERLLKPPAPNAVEPLDACGGEHQQCLLTLTAAISSVTYGLSSMDIEEAIHHDHAGVHILE